MGRVSHNDMRSAPLRMELTKLLADAGVQPIAVYANTDAVRLVEITSVVSDDRDARPGSLMCCLRGTHVDGHDRLGAAVARGAVAALVRHRVDIGALDCVQVEVGDVRPSVGKLASVMYAQPSKTLRVFGVTGTNGKTSTTYILEALLTALRRSVGVIGTVETRFDDVVFDATSTTPDPCALQQLFARMRDGGVDDVAMEISSHALAQGRVSGTTFSAVGFTNLHSDHLDYHGTYDAYADAKRSLFSGEYSQFAAINAADRFGSGLVGDAQRNGMSVVTYGSASSDLFAREIDLSAHGTRLVLDGPVVRREFADAIEVVTPLVGAFNVENTLCAIAMLAASGSGIADAIDGFRDLRQIPGRLEQVGSASGPAIFVDYAHTADALTAVLESLRGLLVEGGRLITVFGCGGDRDRSKRPLMGAQATELSDLAILTTDNPRSEDPIDIVNDVLVGVRSDARPHIELDRRLAIRFALERALPSDIVLIAGKGHETGQIVGDQRLEFDDRIVAAEELRALR